MAKRNPPINLGDAANFTDTGQRLTCTDSRNATWNSGDDKVVVKYAPSGYKP